MNELIRVPTVRVVDENGAMLGVIPTEEGLAKAQEAGLDLVEVSPNSDPPVCKILDYGKFLYEQQKKEQASKRKQHRVQLKEMRFGPKIGDHDLGIKVGRVREFLEQGNRVQITVLFRRRRELRHPEVGRQVIERVIEMVADLGKPEHSPGMEGRRMHTTLAPSKGQATSGSRVPADT